MGTIDEELEKKLKYLESYGKENSKNPGCRIDVKIVTNSCHRYSLVSEISIKPGKPVNHKTVSSKSGIEMLSEELKRKGIECYCFAKDKTNPDDYAVVNLNVSQIRNFASREYVEHIYDDSPIFMLPKRVNKNMADIQPEKDIKGKSKPELENKNNKRQGYHRGSKEE